MAGIIKTGKEKAQRSKQHRRRRLLVVALVALLVASAAIGGVIIYRNIITKNNSETNRDSADEKAVATAQAVESKVKEINATASMNDLSQEKILEEYDRVADETQSPKEKQLVLLRKAQVLSDKEQHGEALSVAKQADAVVSDSSSVSLVARMAELSGDKKTAIDYYKKLLNHYKDNPPAVSGDIEVIKQTVRDLGGEL